MVQFDATRRTLPGFELHRTALEIESPFGVCVEVKFVDIRKNTSGEGDLLDDC